MYRVDIYNSSQPLTIHEPTEDPNDPHLYECKLVQSVSGEIDSLSFKILPDNPGYDQLNCYTTMIQVVDTTARPESAEFVGRVLTVAPNMEESGLVYKSVVCEDRLGYLCDSVQPYVAEQTYYGDSEKTGVQKFVELLLDNHNAQVEDAKKIYPGTISFNTSSGNVTKGLNYQTTWDAIREKLLNDLGGEIQLYSFDGKLYLDYVPSLGTYGEQVIEVAKNMRTATQDESPSDIITRLIPLGDYKDDESESAGEYERINISSVNNGKLYLDDEDAIATFGIIEGTVIWEDVTLPENLLEKGKEWLENQTVEDSLTLSAYDLYLIGIDPDQITPANWYEVKNPLIGLDRYYRCVKRTTNVCDPVDKTYEMGAQNKSLASSVSSNSQSAKDAADAAASINANLSKTVNTLIAGNALILYLEATVADIAYAYIDRAEVEELLAGYATIEYLEAGYATITDLNAAFANVELLNADVANILNLLAGNVGTGDLQAIVLTADNAIIDDAVILNALMGTVLADLIQSNIIYTDQITIMSEDGGISIVGNQMQIVEGQLIFYDSNGNVRMQIGQDSTGNFTFVLYDETGEGIMLDSEGVHASAIPDGLIVDQMVAEDANISASKLNIEELTDTLNSNGQLILSAEQITIGGGTLDYALTEITEQIENLEAMEGVESIENYYILGGPDEPPWDPGEDGSASILGEMILGEAILGTTHWTTEQPKASEGEYIWFSQKITYANGEILWTTPTLLTDDYVRNAITVQQTELEVVQGQIQAKIWMSDIETTADELTTIISDQYGILTVMIDAIDLRVGTLTTSVDYYFTELSSQIAAISLDLSSITAEIRDVDEKYSNALVEGTPYYAVSTDPNFYPPYDVEGQTSVLGKMTLGKAILGVSGNEWTTEQPKWKEGQYIWMTSLRERADGSTYWTEPTLLTDEWIRENATEMEERYSELTMTVGSISAEVVNVWSELALNYSTTTEIKAIIDETVTEESATIMQEVSYNYVDKRTLGDYYTGSAVDALISASASATSGEILQQVSYTYATMDYVSDVLEDLDLNAVVSIDTYYAVSDNQTSPSCEYVCVEDQDFSGGLMPTNWGTNSASYGTLEYETNSKLGSYVKVTNTNAGGVNGKYIQYIFPNDFDNVKVSFDLATEAGYEDDVYVYYYVFIGSGDQRSFEAVYALKSDSWTNYTFELEESYKSGTKIAFQNRAINVPFLLSNVKIYTLGDSGEADWEPYKPDVSAGEYLWMRYLVTYADGHSEWTEPFCPAGSSYTASIEQYVDSQMASISLSVSGGLGNTATITMTTNGSQIIQNLDLSKVRQAFADDESAITIAAGTVAFISNTLLITSTCLELDANGNLTINTNQFTLDTSGNATFSGNLSAPSGNIGGFTIGTSALYNGLSAIANRYSQSGVYVGTNGLAVSDGADAVWITSGSLYQGDGTDAVVMNNCRLTVCNASYTYTGDGGFDIHRRYLYGYHGTSSGYTAWLQISNTSEYMDIAGTLRVNGSSITGSDESLKKSLTPVEDPEAFTGERDYDKVVNSLEPVTFQYQEETGTKKHIGFTYQNAVEALEAGGIDPDECAMVQETTDPDTGETTGGIEYNDIVALLVYEIKKLKSEIQEMKGE